MSLTLIQGDTAPVLRGTITNDETGEPLNLTDCDVFFQMRKKDDNRYTINGQCDLVVAIDGTVRYVLGPNDLNTPGEYQGQFEVHYPDLTVQTTAAVIPISVRRQ